MFRYAVETERRFYLANDVKLNVSGDAARPVIEVELTRRMGVGHVPQDPVRAEGAGADVQGRQRRGAPPAGDLSRVRRGRTHSAEHASGPAAGEDLAARWYAAHGYDVLARNWRVPRGRARPGRGRPAAARRVLRGEDPHHATRFGEPRRGGHRDQAGAAATAGGRSGWRRAPPARRGPLRRGRRAPGRRARGHRRRVLADVRPGRRRSRWRPSTRGASGGERRARRPAPPRRGPVPGDDVAVAARGTGSSSSPRRAAPGGPRPSGRRPQSLTPAGPTARGPAATTRRRPRRPGPTGGGASCGTG